MATFENSWDDYLEEELKKEYFLRLKEFLAEEYREKTIFPPKEDVFNALRTTAYDDVKVLLLGQDPYHGAGEAHGMAFSVRPGVRIPPSLKNIFAELHTDLGCSVPNNGYLMKWAKQGVLLLNTVLTVEKDKANSHKGKGWEIFTDRVISLLNQREKPVIFLLWGANARAKLPLITAPQHYVLSAAHPSPLSASRGGFFGCRHFSKCNRILSQEHMEPIDWQIENIEKEERV